MPRMKSQTPSRANLPAMVLIVTGLAALAVTVEHPQLRAYVPIGGQGSFIDATDLFHQPSSSVVPGNSPPVSVPSIESTAIPRSTPTPNDVMIPGLPFPQDITVPGPVQSPAGGTVQVTTVSAVRTTGESTHAPEGAIGRVIAALRHIAGVLAPEQPLLALRVEKAIVSLEALTPDAEGALSPEDLATLRTVIRDIVSQVRSAVPIYVSTPPAPQPTHVYTFEEMHEKIGQYLALAPTVIQFAVERGAQVSSSADTFFNQAQQAYASGDISSALEALAMMKKIAMRAIDAAGLTDDVDRYALQVLTQHAAPVDEPNTGGLPHLEGQ